MKLRHVPARTGVQWVRQGIRTFWRQPLALAGLFFMFMLLMSLLAMLPYLGTALALALLPAATLGLMVATRDADRGAFPMPQVLASAFQAGKDRRHAMLVLGGLYAIGSFLVMLLTTWILGEPGGALQEGVGVTEEVLKQPIVLQTLLLNMVLYLPLGLLFWHAPALVHWHGISPVKSLFFSFMACWTNKAALTVYFLAWSVVFLAVSFVLVVITSIAGGTQLLGMVIFPVAMLLSAMFFVSLYYTFRDSFLTDDGQAPA